VIGCRLFATRKRLDRPGAVGLGWDDGWRACCDHEHRRCLQSRNGHLWGSSHCGVGGRYDLASDTWKPFSSAGALTRRSMQTLAWTGEAMIVYGGTVGTHLSRDTNSGAMYVP
jgi:hypothetical protein